MEIINGKAIADKLLSELGEKIRRQKIRPCLAVVMAGANPASEIYLEIKEKRAKEAGINFKKLVIAEEVSDREIIDLIGSLNQDKAIHGIIVQLPLPENNSTGEILEAIDLAKDVDGLKEKSPYFSPFILSIWQALSAARQDLTGKKIVALVRSEIFGQRLEKFFKARSLNLEYLTKLDDLSLALQADVLITALGSPNFIKSSMVKPGAIIIDGGISRQNNRLTGDVDQEGVQARAAWLSPAPGGVGPLTVFFLLNNLYLAANQR